VRSIVDFGAARLPTSWARHWPVTNPLPRGFMDLGLASRRTRYHEGTGPGGDGEDGCSSFFCPLLPVLRRIPLESECPPNAAVDFADQRPWYSTVYRPEPLGGTSQEPEGVRHVTPSPRPSHRLQSLLLPSIYLGRIASNTRARASCFTQIRC
jgi:hypothetical protein